MYVKIKQEFSILSRMLDLYETWIVIYKQQTANDLKQAVMKPLLNKDIKKGIEN